MSNIIDSIKLSGVTYTIQGSGGGGNPTVELTQAQYDALVTAGTVQADTYYIITDASAGDLSNYMSSAQTMSAITEATSGKVDSNVYTAYTASTDTAIQGKQDTLVSGTNIKTINNESLLGSGNITIQGGGGGGKAISAGTNISVTTGETADTINCTLPFVTDNLNNIKLNYSNTFSGKLFSNQIYGWNNELIGKTNFDSNSYTSLIGYNNKCHRNNYTSVIGENNTLGNVYGNNSYNYVFGKSNTISPSTSDNSANNNYIVGRDNKVDIHSSNYIFGYGIIPKNSNEFSIGKYNKSVTDGTESGSTYFSIGNGTSTASTANVFEIRQNGDIYITSGGTDILLQDHLGGGNVPESRLNLLHGYGTSGGTDLFSWSTGSTSQVINEYVAFSKINNTSIICGKNTSPTNFSLVETSAITTSITSSSTDAQVPSAKAVNDKLGGLTVVKLTESEYTALVTKDSNTLYVVVPDPSN